MLLKGTHSGVDGVYSADPKLDPTAKRYDGSPSWTWSTRTCGSWT